MSVSSSSLSLLSSFHESSSLSRPAWMIVSRSSTSSISAILERISIQFGSTERSMVRAESGRSSANVVRAANWSAVKAYRKRLEILGRARRTSSTFWTKWCPLVSCVDWRVGCCCCWCRWLGSFDLRFNSESVLLKYVSFTRKNNSGSD